MSIPTIDKLFVEQAGVFVDGVANAYMDASATKFGSDATAIAASYPLTKAFVDFTKALGNTTYDLELEDQTKILGNYTSDDLASLSGTTLTLKDKVGGKNNDNGTQKGYKQELILNVTNAKFAGAWAYGEEDAVNYSFKVKMMSPILEGQLFTTDLANGIVVPSTAIDGFKVDNSYVQGETYNKEVYSIFSDKLTTTASPSPWKRKEIAAVNFKSTNTNLFDVTSTGTNYQEVGDDKTPVYGYATITPVSLAETTTGDMEITVTDAWGYKLTQNVKVTIEVK